MRRPSTLMVIIGIVLAVGILGGGLFYAASRGGTATPQAQTNTAATDGTANLRTNDYSDNPQQGPDSGGTDGTDPTGTTQASASTVFGDGTYLVGSNIAPGTYKSDGQDDCTWKRLKALGGYRNVIASGETNGSATVTIQASDKAFSAKGCGTWTKQS